MQYIRRQSTQEAVIRMKIWMQGAFVVVAAAALCGAAAQAQTDVALSGYGTFTSSTSGFGTQQTPSNSAGGILELRHIVNPLVGYEFDVSFNPANQAYAPKTGNCGFVCGEPPLSVSGKATQFGVNWVVSMKSGKLRPFALGGVGLMITVPGNSPYAVNTVVRPVFVYGGGVDWTFAPHFGLRLQARGNMSKAPNLSDLYTSTTVYTQIYEPMAGVFYRF
jgi:hypothetical protein